MSQLMAIDENITGTQGNSHEKPQVLKFEPTEYFENFFASYNPVYI